MSFARWVEALRENASSILSDEVIVRLKSADFAATSVRRPPRHNVRRAISTCTGWAHDKHKRGLAEGRRVAGAWPAVIVGEGSLTDDSTRQD